MAVIRESRDSVGETVISGLGFSIKSEELKVDVCLGPLIIKNSSV